MNWIEQRAVRQKVLGKHATDVWQDVVTAIDNCCRSFRKHYPQQGKVENKTANGHRLVITVLRAEERADVQITFSDHGPCITVVADAQPPTHFQIDADRAHSFLVHDGKEITADDFSRIILSEILFPAE